MNEEKQFTMSMFVNAEALHKAKSEYYMEKFRREEIKNLRLSKQIVEMKRAVAGIAPWLSASLDDLSDGRDGKYEAACNEVFRLDDIGDYLNNPDVGEAL